MDGRVEMIRPLRAARRSAVKARTQAFNQLLAEGYLESRMGSGTYVATKLPDELLRVRLRRRQAVGGGGQRKGILSRRGESLSAVPLGAMADAGQPCPVRPWVPDLDEFPWRLWSRLLARYHRRPRRWLLTYGEPAGYRPLRRAIAEHLGAARGVRCSWEQVIVVSGSQQALDLAARMLLDPGDAAWVEDPGYAGTRGALVAAGADVVPVMVDGEGLDVNAGVERRPGARLACVTPSHQYPLGVTMSLARRLQLLDWAERAGAWVLENDYDSEYRYAGRPLAALQGLDTGGRVIYTGTFSKVLFPALRVGYLVAPPDLVDAFAAARAFADRGSAPVEQAVLADFLVEGHFASHVRRMRALYAERQQALVEAARRELAGLLDVPRKDSGMHLLGRLPDGVRDVDASLRAAEAGVEAPALSAFGLVPPRRGGLVLSYAAVSEGDIREGVERLRTALAGLQ
jgi:GntR family transcriptional regulator/MocR family aminotransferase